MDSIDDKIYKWCVKHANKHVDAHLSNEEFPHRNALNSLVGNHFILVSQQASDEVFEDFLCELRKIRNKIFAQSKISQIDNKKI